MSNTDGTCEYVLDPEAPETWGGEEGDECYVDEDVLNKDGVWTCPHDAEEGEELCIFHLPITKKDDEEVADAFLGAIKQASSIDTPSTQERKLQFIGARFGTFELNQKLPENVCEMNCIDVSCSYITEINWFQSINGRHNVGTIRFSGATFKQNANFDTVQFNDRTSFIGAHFHQEADFSLAEFGDAITFEGAVFNSNTSFYKTKFGDDTVFDCAEFNSDVTFKKSNFGNKTSFQETNFDEKITFEEANFGIKTRFLSTNFGDNISFERVVFGKEKNRNKSEPDGNKTFLDETHFWLAEFGDDASFDDAVFNVRTAFLDTTFGNNASFWKVLFNKRVLFGSAEFGDEASFGMAEFGGDADFNKVEFGDNASFSETEFGGETEFSRAEFDEGVNFRSLDLDGSQFNNADLTDAKFIKANLRKASFESVLLSRAILFGADLRGVKLSGAVLGDVRIDEDTKFLGHPSDDSNTSPHTLSAIRSRPTCVYDPGFEEDNEHEDVDKAKSVYRALEELGGKHARPRLQARSFVRRQDLQKNEYNWDAKEAESWEERLIAGARWGRAKVARAILLYGESPWRVIAWSLSIIVSFALLYPLGGWMKPTDSDPINYAQIASNPVEILNSVYYSTLTYTALGFGDFQPVGLGRLLTTLETGLGAVMLALLVFILGRRAAR